MRQEQTTIESGRAASTKSEAEDELRSQAMEERFVKSVSLVRPHREACKVEEELIEEEEERRR